jgi:hypothetical protein
MRRALLTLVCALISVGHAVAAEADEPAGWQFEVAPYAWIPGTYGTIDVRGRTAHADTGPGEILSLLFKGDALAAGGYFAARYDRWSAFLDAFGGFVKESIIEDVPTRFCTLSIGAKGTIHPLFVDVAFGYELGEWTLAQRSRPVSLGVYAGMRYTHLGVDLSGALGVNGGVQRNAAASDSFDWADPMIGVRWEVPLLDRLTLDFRGDIGGFHASSNLTWGIVSDLRYWMEWSPWDTQPWLGAGYRVIAFDHDFKGTNDADLQFRGPMMALGFVF